MPIVSAFYGMLIRIYHADHNPPHFHVQYGDASAIVEIVSGRMLYGKLPARSRRLLEEWRKLRRHELERAWKASQAMRPPSRIKPLE